MLKKAILFLLSLGRIKVLEAPHRSWLGCPKTWPRLECCYYLTILSKYVPVHFDLIVVKTESNNVNAYKLTVSNYLITVD